MLATAVSLLVISFVLVLMTAYWAWKSYQRHKLNLVVSDELHEILTSAHEIVKNNRKKITTPDGSEPDIMDSPELMSTIITVLVSKYGTVRLSMKDFMIPDDEYVSVYVDTATQEVILSLDHNLTLESQLANFTKPDDTTFH
tara:strand:- start:468 stop:893 length:426 start_codon:yes stop_codon:yes gene_type:complete